ncbi:MAG TPA: glycosyltransferase family 2 protein [Candidatus Eremiobacteraceae bacterium]|nr:glycosyltransferase family 2 protein [Candidatus Eremiobacteraceae bacterium]
MGITISVAMCTFNGMRFLRAQLESVAAQERPPDELVVCDDGSSDGCEEIVREFSGQTTFPTRLVINERNLGTTKNFEKAISLCEGTIVALADQDDVWYPHKLARIEKAFLESPAAVAVFSDADLIDVDANLLRVSLWDSFLFDARDRKRFANGNAVQILTRNHIVTGATMAFRKKFFDILAPFHDFHDRWLAFLLATCGQFEPIADRLMQYRRHEGQQFGPGSLTVREEIMRIRKTDANVYLGEIERFHKLHEKLEKHKANFRYADLAQREIKRKISHLERRVQLPGRNVARIPEVLREVLKGDYWRYSAGWKSVAKDLVQRPQR